MMRKFLRAATACVFCIAISSPAIAQSLQNIQIEDAGSSVIGDLTIDQAGIYEFALQAGAANVEINGARIIDADSGAGSGTAALSAGAVSVMIETMNGSPAPGLQMALQGGTDVIQVFGAPSAPTINVQTGQIAGPVPLRQATSTASAMQAPGPAPARQAATTANAVQVDAPRDLRNRLRSRVRERAIEMALLNNEIARATVNGEVSDYVRVGQQITVTATPPAGMRFVRWAGDVFALEDPNQQETLLTVNAGGANVFSVFESDAPAPTPTNPAPPGTPPTNPNPPGTPPPPPPGTPTFTVTVNSGTGDGAFAEGTQVVVRADTPLVGETFAAWTGDIAALADPNSPVTTLTVPAAAVTITATYRASAMSVSLFSSSTTAFGRGATISGVVNDPQGDSVTYDVIGPNGSATATGLTASMNPDTGAFAARVFDNTLPDSGQVTVVVNAETANAADAVGVVNFYVSNGTDEIAQLVSRTSYGASPASLARARQIGYDAYLNEQLNPTSIDDSAFRALNPDDLYDYTDNDGRRELRRLAMAYAIYTERQLQEVMANFWENHFYTSPDKDDAEFAETVEKAAFRENALGNFADLLEISAKSPVMMSFLDNTDSRDGNINENYARELLELHTVGVNSSYTEDDIIEVARILTGWRLRTTNPDRPNGVRRVHEFFFDEGRHDDGDKVISFLNTTIQGISGPQGIQEGEQLLQLLAAHPDTASFICGKLVQLFVSDAPQPTLTSRCASTFLSSNGNIRDLVELILRSDEFRRQPANQFSKYKTPLEYVASLVRGLELTPRAGRFADSMSSLGNEMDDAGYEMYDFQAPTGLPEVSGAWVGAASVVQRTQFGVRAARAGTANLDLDHRAILDAAPAETAEGVAALICDRIMQNRCTQKEFEEMVDAVYGDDGLFDPSRNVDTAISRALQVAAGSQSFGLQ